MIVSCQELPDPQGAGAMIGPHEDGITETASDQLHPAENECAHQDVAQLGVCLNDRKKMLAIDLGHFARDDGTDTNERGPTR